MNEAFLSLTPAQIRHRLHAAPELSGQETETARRVADWLELEVGLPEYREAFFTQRVNGACMALGLSDKDLDELGVKPLGH